MSQNAVRTMAMSDVMARAGLWSALTFVLNVTWEIAQVRLYTLWDAADGISIAWALLHYTLGDAVIALAMFAVAGIMLWRLDWPELHPLIGSVIVVIGAMAFTAWSEWYNVYSAANWAYAASQYADDLRHWAFPAHAMADLATGDCGRLPKASSLSGLMGRSEECGRRAQFCTGFKRIVVLFARKHGRK